MSPAADSASFLLALPAGTMLRGQYRLEGVLGRPGAFGIVYLARDLQLNISVAIKEFLPAELAGRAPNRTTVLPHSASSADLFRYGLQRFMEEGQTVARLDHPSIVRVKTYFEENGTAYLVMAYYEGCSLDEYLEEQGGRLPPRLAVEFMIRVLDGLSAAHRGGVLHRDVKPGNIYLTHDARPILLDFGAARQAVGQKSRNVTAILTPGYAPVEQYGVQGRNQGPWTDVYACAATLYRMITGVDPPDAPDRMSGEDELAPPSRHVANLPPGLEAAILQGLAMGHRARPQSAEAFSELLTVGLAPHLPPKKPEAPPEPPPPEPPPPQPSRNRAPAIAAGAVAILVVVGVVKAFSGDDYSGGSDQYTTDSTVVSATDTTVVPGTDTVPVALTDTLIGSTTDTFVGAPVSVPPPPPPPPPPPADPSDGELSMVRQDITDGNGFLAISDYANARASFRSANERLSGLAGEYPDSNVLASLRSRVNELLAQTRRRCRAEASVGAAQGCG